QCFQCANPPCVQVCPVSATWQEPDGIVVVDYDWCIGCRYCIAACPYWARRFNWSEPHVPAEELNPNQHYLGNRARKKGVVEKCTFCIQRTREGRLPACAEACPTGARVFGNLLDPNSEIRWVLENKRVFRLKEDLNTEPRFWYFMDCASMQHLTAFFPTALASSTSGGRRNYLWMGSFTLIMLIGAFA